MTKFQFEGSTYCIEAEDFDCENGTCYVWWQEAYPNDKFYITEFMGEEMIIELIKEEFQEFETLTSPVNHYAQIEKDALEAGPGHPFWPGWTQQEMDQMDADFFEYDEHKLVNEGIK